MSAVRDSKSSFAVDKSAHAENQVRDGGSTFASRLQAAAREKGWDQARLAAESKVPKPRVSDYWNGPKEPAANYLFALAHALDVSAEWLALGVGRKRTDGLVIDASEADFVAIPRYDLRELTDTGKGAPVETVPIRRDWLYRRLLVSTGLWLTELPTDYEWLNLAEGDVVVCSDIQPGTGPQNGWICIFRGEGGAFVSVYRADVYATKGRLPPEEDFLIAGRAVNYKFVTGYDLEQGWVHPVARIHAKLFAKL